MTQVHFTLNSEEVQNIIGNHDYSRDLLLKLVSILYIDYLFKNINSRVNSTDVFNFEVLSNGEVQKLRLLRALIREPQLLLLDEAFSMINREEAIAILVSIRKIFPKMLIVFVEHHLEVDCKEIIIKDNNLSISF
ncbi:ATP-binding cassette domain-containing protein [Ignavigranum ruoffiae]|uniref:ATP-binding cassette domain-containing protein n=1 Tax=Ignavigranum ruoffiae TaxID=89093 RepID=UPI00205033CA|nr:ATP-binding cassette domain-containing protein [Ignavigranum ruoffiae]UPQ85839.1 ATP-binding cassette domain-containing protein [Ignavigranum ruoffiae]